MTVTSTSGGVLPEIDSKRPQAGPAVMPPNTSSSEAISFDGPCDVAPHDTVTCLKSVCGTFSSLRAAVSNSAGSPTCPDLNFDLQVAHGLVTNMLRHIHYLQNASQPIMRLPPEILLYIFRLIRGENAEYSHSSGDDVGRAYSIRWMRILRVCSYWRDLANFCPSLWDSIRLVGYEGRTRIKRSQGDYIRIFLEHSAHNLLRVCLSHKAENTNEVDQLLEHLPRFVHLDLSGCDFSDRLKLFAKPATELRTLVVDARYAQTKRFAPPLVALFTNGLPSLQSLALKAIRLDPVIHVQGLRQLHLSGIGFRTVKELHTLESVLNSMHDLEDLECNSLDIQVSADQCGLVTLPKLRRLAMKSNGGTNVLLSAIQLPSDVFVSCETTLRSPEVLPLDRSRLGDLEQPTKVKFVFTDQGACRLYALGKTSALQGSKLYFDHEAQNIFLILRGFLDHAEEVWIEGTLRSVLRRKTIIKAFEHAPAVRRIVLDLWDRQSLSRSVRALIPVPETPCHLPNLQEIVICNPEAGVFDHTLRMLRLRKERGCPIRRLQVGQLSDRSSPASLIDVAFNWWKGEGLLQLRSLVDEVEIVDNMSRPMMGPLPICHAASTGFWAWPTWEET